MALQGSDSANTGKSAQWERYVIGLLMAGLVTWIWDIRTELTAVRREQDKRMALVQIVERLQTVQEDRAIKLAVLEHDLQVIKGRLDTMTRRILSLAERLDRVAPKTGMYIPDDVPGIE